MVKPETDVCTVPEKLLGGSFLHCGCADLDVILFHLDVRGACLRERMLLRLCLTVIQFEFLLLSPSSKTIRIQNKKNNTNNNVGTVLLCSTSLLVAAADVVEAT